MAEPQTGAWVSIPFDNTGLTKVELEESYMSTRVIIRTQVPGLVAKALEQAARVLRGEPQHG